MSKESRIRVLALHARYTDQLSYFDDWLDALKSYAGFSTVEFDILKPPDELRGHIGATDAIVALHSTNGDTTMHLERHVGVLSDRRVPLISFVGNELNLPDTPIAAKRRVLGQIRPEWIATQMLQEAGEFLFGDLPSHGVVSIPHALNVSSFRSLTDPKVRPIDIGTRVARYLPHMGDDDRNRIADRFIDVGRARGLSTDISHERHNRDGWASFLNRCKGTISSEAGSWFIERDDATVNAIQKRSRQRAEQLEREARGTMEIPIDSVLLKLGYRLPPRLQRLAAHIFRSAGGRFESEAPSPSIQPETYEEIYARFFAGKPRPTIYGKCVSSRHFDAVGTKTCQIMFRGRFNDILQADHHYLALDPDFGNLNDVLRRFGDEGERTAVTEAAHEHVLAGHTYKHRMQQVEGLLRKS
jgi:hypothetical protein